MRQKILALVFSGLLLSSVLVYSQEESDAVPIADSGLAYVQYFAYPNKIMLILEDGESVEVKLTGFDQVGLNFNEEYYWEFVNVFLHEAGTLRYAKTGEMDGMNEVVLYYGGANLNQYLMRYATVRYLPVYSSVVRDWAPGGGALAIRSRLWENRANERNKNYMWLHSSDSDWVPNQPEEEVEE